MSETLVKRAGEALARGMRGVRGDEASAGRGRWGGAVQRTVMVVGWRTRLVDEGRYV